MRDGGRRYRLHVFLGALAMIASGFLTWWRAGGGEVAGIPLPAQEGIGLEGPGVVIYAAAVVALIVLDLGYMRGPRGLALDVPATYLVLGIASAAALLYRGWELWSVGYIPLPQQSPGLALAAVGVALVLFGASSGFGVPRRY